MGVFPHLFQQMEDVQQMTVRDCVKKDALLVKTAELCFRNGFNPSFATQFLYDAG